MAFHDAATPEDLPASHQGDYDGPNCGYALYGEPALCTCGTCNSPQEQDDTALTTWLDARQPNLEPIDALTGQKDS